MLQGMGIEYSVKMDKVEAGIWLSGSMINKGIRGWTAKI